MIPEALIAALFGLLIGSFLNVCIFRLPYDLTPANPPRSFCPKCETTIAWYDNIPLLSFLLLKGKCRSCSEPISYRYPLVELLTAACFFLAVYRFSTSWDALKLILLSIICIDLIFTDFEERILPDEFTIGGAVVGFLLAFKVTLPPYFVFFLLPSEARTWVRSPLEALLSGLFCAGVLWLARFIYFQIRHKEGMGLGDVKMVGMLGAFFGLMPALFSLMAGAMLGSVLGLLLILFAKKDAATYEVPFGSFLGIAALGIAFFGPRF